MIHQNSYNTFLGKVIKFFLRERIYTINFVCLHKLNRAEWIGLLLRTQFNKLLLFPHLLILSKFCKFKHAVPVTCAALYTFVITVRELYQSVAMINGKFIIRSFLRNQWIIYLNYLLKSLL